MGDSVKSFAKVKTTSTTLPSSTEPVVSLWKAIRSISHNFPFTNPFWLLATTFLLSIYLEIVSRLVVSSISQGDTDQLVVTWILLLAFPENRVAFAFFQSLRTSLITMSFQRWSRVALQCYQSAPLAFVDVSILVPWTCVYSFKSSQTCTEDKPSLPQTLSLVSGTWDHCSKSYICNNWDEEGIECLCLLLQQG